MNLLEKNIKIISLIFAFLLINILPVYAGGLGLVEVQGAIINFLLPQFSIFYLFFRLTALFSKVKNIKKIDTFAGIGIIFQCLLFVYYKIYLNITNDLILLSIIFFSLPLCILIYYYFIDKNNLKITILLMSICVCLSNPYVLYLPVIVFKNDILQLFVALFNIFVPGFFAIIIREKIEK